MTDREKPTPRQMEILQLVAYGLTDKEVAIVLGCSSNTVRTQVQSILLRTGARTRTEAACRGIRLGWIE